MEDNFLFIWFRVFEKYKLQLLNEKVKEKIIDEILVSNLGILFEREVKRVLSFEYEKLDSYFNKEGVEIDLIGKRDEVYDIYECKFQKNVNEKKIVKEVKSKLKYLPKGIKIGLLNLVSINKGISLKDLFDKSRLK